MSEVFSEHSRFFLENYREVRAAESRVRADFQTILQAAEPAFKTGLWYARCGSAAEELRLEHLQVFKRTWPLEDGNHVHFEVGIDRKSLENHRIYVALDVEGTDVPWEGRDKFLRRLDFLLQRYEPSFRSAIPASHTPGTQWHSVLWELQELPSITSERIVQAMRSMMRFETLVDEALYLLDKRCVWRTDFLSQPEDPVLGLTWGKPPAKKLPGGDPGGQRINPGLGRFGSVCLRIDGTMCNYGPDAKGPPTQNICAIAHRPRMTGIPNGTRVFLSAVVRTTVGAQVAVHAYGDTERQGKQEWPLAFKDRSGGGRSRTCDFDITPKDDWQHVRWEGEVVSLDWCDFAEVGFSLFLITETKDENMLVDSIEFGVIE